MPGVESLKSKFVDIPDEDLLNHLKHLAAQWFSNDEILLLEELFRRHANVKVITTD